MRALNARARASLAARLALGRSRIDGTGLFAREAIEADDVVIEYTGEVVGERECGAREKLYERLGIADYMFRTGADEVVDATLRGSRARYCNHSCDPNCYAVVHLNDEAAEGQGPAGGAGGAGGAGSGSGAGGAAALPPTRRIFVYALRRIEAGEEVTYDYSFSASETAIVCRCGAASCRGTLNKF